MGVNFYDTAKVLKISPLEAAKLYIDEAAKAGVDCAKFQSYKASKIASVHSPAYWDTSKESTQSQYELFKKFDSFNESEYRELSRYSHEKGLDFTSTPFDYESADYLSDLVDFYKISSSDVSNLPFIEHVAKKGKPLVISAGASFLSEVDEVIRVALNSGVSDLTILHCVLSYPTRQEDANLLVIKTLKEVFPNVRVGYSDHVIPDPTMQTLSTAYLLGAQVIEKHFTLDKTLKGNDHYHAGDPTDFRTARQNFDLINNILGNPEKTVLECEYTSRKEARRSLVATKKIEKGDVITAQDIIAKRPGTGISPRFADIVIGRTAKENIEEDQILTWDLI